MHTETDTSDAFLAAVRTNLNESLAPYVLYREMDKDIASLTNGKMLRSRLIHAVGSAVGTNQQQLISAAVAVEMLHAASLLHDDVIDGGTVRRGTPALWTTRGPSVAILSGGLLLSLSFAKIAASQPHAVPVLADALRLMCEAEIEQSCIQDHSAFSWGDYLRIARGKTGSLFGFSAYCAAGENHATAQALWEAGNQIGIAYQMADDLLDLRGDDKTFGKTLGTDAATGKVTAAAFWQKEEMSPQTLLQPSLDKAREAVSSWMPLQQTLQAFIKNTLQPAIDSYTEPFSQ